SSFFRSLTQMQKKPRHRPRQKKIIIPKTRNSYRHVHPCFRARLRRSPVILSPAIFRAAELQLFDPKASTQPEATGCPETARMVEILSDHNRRCTMTSPIARALCAEHSFFGGLDAVWFWRAGPIAPYIFSVSVPVFAISFLFVHLPPPRQIEMDADRTL